MPTPFFVARGAARLVASAGVRKVVSDVVKNNVTINSQLDQLLVLVGKTVLSTMAIDLAVQHVDSKIDEAVAWYQEKVKSDTEEAPKEAEEETK